MNTPNSTHKRFRLSPSLIIAMLALVLAVPGAAVAKSLISGKSIKKGTIPVTALSSSARKSLTGKTGPVGPVGAVGARGLAGPAGPGGAAGAPGAAGASLFTNPLPAGTVLRGALSLSEHGLSASDAVGAQVSLPTTIPGDPKIRIGTKAVTGGIATSAQIAAAADPAIVDNTACAGDAGTPTATAGTLCLYFENLANVKAGSLTGYSTFAASRNTFYIQGVTNLADDYLSFGAFAYTAG